MQSKRAPDPGTVTSEPSPRQRSACGGSFRRLLAGMLCFSILTVSGCGGCRPDGDMTKAEREAEAKKKLEELKKKKKKKPDFEPPQVEVRPGLPGERPKSVKPGHWISGFKSSRRITSTSWAILTRV